MQRLLLIMGAATIPSSARGLTVMYVEMIQLKAIAHASCVVAAQRVQPEAPAGFPRGLALEASADVP